jgi:DNA-binding transcriptional LysR family regulator
VPVPFVVAFVSGVTPNKWVGVWKERMPDSPIEIRQTTEAEARSGLVDGSVDAAFLRFDDDPKADDFYSVIELYTELPVVVAPKDHTLTAFDTVDLSDLAGENILEGQPADTVELVAANVGVAIMPQSVARVHSRKDVFARLLTGVPVTKIALVWPIDRTTDAVDEFVGIVRGRTANSSRSPQGEAEAPAKKPGNKGGKPDPKKTGAKTPQSRRIGSRPSKPSGRPRKR